MCIRDRCEGAWDEDGKSPVQVDFGDPGTTYDRRYIHYLNADGSRGKMRQFDLLPKGAKYVLFDDVRYTNHVGIDFYHRYKEDVYKRQDYLLEKGIEPVVSLVHFDMPDHLLREYNGFLNKKVIDLYAKHVETVVTRMKGKVKYWLTYNEINLAPYQSDLVA